MLTTLLVLLFAHSTVATQISTSTDSNDSEYDIQSLLWEHDAIFNSVLEWAQAKTILTSTQVRLLQNELESRLLTFAENEGSDVQGMKHSYFCE